jgi:hypothetical protein
MFSPDDRYECDQPPETLQVVLAKFLASIDSALSNSISKQEREHLLAVRNELQRTMEAVSEDAPPAETLNLLKSLLDHLQEYDQAKAPGVSSGR